MAETTTPKQYRKRSIVITASQWFKAGDHPEVKNGAGPGEWPVGSIMVEGKPAGYIEGGHIVTPGDWIIQGIAGEFYPCKPDIFAATYDLADDDGNRHHEFKAGRRTVE